MRHVTDEAALKIIVDAFPARTPCRFIDGPGGDPFRPAGADRAQRGRQPAAALEDRCAGPDGREGETDGRTIVWPDDLPVGAYRLLLTDAARRSEEVPFIVAPPRAFGGDFDRGWLLAVQLYGVRSARNWGMGDFTDLEGLIELAGSSAPTASASIRCMRCSTTGRATAAPIRRTAGCS